MDQPNTDTGISPSDAQGGAQGSQNPTPQGTPPPPPANGATATPEDSTPLMGAQPTGEAPEGQGEDGQKAPEGDPQPFEIKVPDGFEIAPSLMEAVQKSFQKGGAEGAQELIDAYAKYVQDQAVEAEELARNEHIQRVARWTEQVQRDKEVGGVNFTKSMADVRRALAKFGSPELNTFFQESGLGSHPELFKLVARVGAAMAEDSITGTTAPAAQNSEQEILQKMYPTMFKE